MTSNNYSLNRMTLSEQVADKLESMILEDTTQFKGKLPSEQVLAVTFSVSRTVIREALVILRAKGLIVKSNGSCSKVTSNPSENLDEVLQRVIRLRNIQPIEIYEMRQALEVLAIRLAASRRTKDDILQLRKLVNDIEAVKDDMPQRTERDLAFHMKIIEVSGNTLLLMLAGTIFVLLKPLILDALNLVGTSTDALALHTKLVDAIERGDEDDAQDQILKHLALSMRNFELSLQKSNYRKNKKTNGKGKKTPQS